MTHKRGNEKKLKGSETCSGKARVKSYQNPGSCVITNPVPCQLVITLSALPGDAREQTWNFLDAKQILNQLSNRPLEKSF